MESLIDRVEDARKTVSTLREMTDLSTWSVRDRDAAIMRFSYSFEAVWKATRDCLRQRESLDAFSPKSTIRYAREARLPSDADAEAALKMANDRNLAVHLYREQMAIELGSRLRAHAGLLDRWVTSLESRVAVE